jgi:hypothetical protein
VRLFVAICLIAWGGGLSAAEITVEADGRIVIPTRAIAVELRLTDAKPTSAAADKRVLARPGLFSPAAEWRSEAGILIRLELCLTQRPLGLSEVLS